MDAVEEMGENTISGFYQTSPDDYYFKGHFVGFPIMPGSLVVEALGQLSTIILRKKAGESHRDYHFLAYDIKSAQFFKPIFPGERIELRAEVLGVYPIKGTETRVAHIKSRALVKEDIRCEARFSMAIVRKAEFEKRYGRK